MLMSEQARKNIISNAMFRRNARSIRDKKNFFHHLHKAIRKNKYGLLKHISKYPVQKRHDKSRVDKKTLHRRAVKTFHRKLLPKNTRRIKDIRSKNVVNKRRLRKKFNARRLVKRTGKKVLERGNFHRREHFSGLIRSRLAGKYKNNRHLSNTRAVLIP